MKLQGNWRIPTEILAGAGRISELAGRVRDLGVKRALVVTDPGVAALPFFASILAGLEKAGIAAAVYKDVHPDPVADDVAAGVRAFVGCPSRKSTVAVSPPGPVKSNVPVSSRSCA